MEEVLCGARETHHVRRGGQQCAVQVGGTRLVVSSALPDAPAVASEVRAVVVNRAKPIPALIALSAASFAIDAPLGERLREVGGRLDFEAAAEELAALIL
eukprot:scaffold351_cov248-Pinguiococcus_pyrenoidosus.AAC.9